MSLDAIGTSGRGEEHLASKQKVVRDTLIKLRQDYSRHFTISQIITESFAYFRKENADNVTENGERVGLTSIRLEIQKYRDRGAVSDDLEKYCLCILNNEDIGENAQAKRELYLRLKEKKRRKAKKKPQKKI